jgi:hypothetical protein
MDVQTHIWNGVKYIERAPQGVASPYEQHHLFG